MRSPWVEAGLAARRVLAAAIGAAAASGIASAEDARLALGREVFLERAEPRCPVCHTLAAAGATGEIGPNLDTLAPDAERVRRAVTEGVGPMRPYEGLTAEEIDALAHYVATAAGG